MMNPIPAEVFNIRQENRAWVDRRCVPQSLATFEMPALIGSVVGSAVGSADGSASKPAGKPAGGSAPKQLYILADGWDPSPFRHFAKQVDGKPGWQVVKLACSHDVMVDRPDELAAELQALA